MTNANTNKLSASHIRYLLVLKKLAASDLGVRSVELAAELGVSKPSVCNMLCVLAEMKLVDKQPRSIVYLTQAGNQMAEKYSEYYDAVFAILTKYISEIARVLKSNGILIAPTFTMADTFLGKMQMRIMELSGFKVFHKWFSDAYLKYLNASGFKVIKSCTVGGTAKLTYAEANKINKLKRWIQNGKNDFKD